MEELDFDLKETLISAINTKNSKKLKEIFDTIPTIDIAEALEELEDVKMLLYIFRVVSKEYTGDFFTELTNEQKELIVNSFSDKDLIELLENSFADDIADTVEELPANLVRRILTVAPPDLRKDVNSLLNYKENTAGSIMTTEYIEMKDDLTVSEAIKILRDKGKSAETIYTIFIRDAKRTLEGTIDLDDLIFANENTLLSEIMNKDYVTCNVNDDQEQIANDFKRYDLNVMAVTNNQDKLVGIITSDDIMDILVEEANEDIALLNNVSSMDEPYLKTPIFKLVFKCIPWIVALMILQIGSAAITSHFDHLIASFAVLAVFSPLILDAGGNSGGQTTTMIVRSLALDEFDKGDFKKVLWKEFRVSLIIALIVGIFAFGWTFFEMAVLNIGDVSANNITTDELTAKLYVSVLVGSTLVVTMIISRMIGCILPFIAKKVKIDPAVMCGPFTTTIVDIISLLTYFVLWENVFKGLIGII